MTIRTVGFIGLGTIGLPAARNLLQAGFEVVGFSLTNLDALAAAGGKAAGSARDVAAECDIIIQCLPVAAALESAVYGEGGTLRALRPGTVVIELSSYALADKKRLLASIEEAGGRLLDCELTARSAGKTVAERECVIFISGEQEFARTMQPVFEGITRHCVYLGGFGTSLKLKTVNNLLVAIHTVAAAEAMALGQKAGIDLSLMADLLTRGAGGSAALANCAPRIARGNFDDDKLGEIKTFNKYFSLIEELATTCGAATPLANVARGYLHQAVAMGHGERDLAAVYKVFESDWRS